MTRYQFELGDDVRLAMSGETGTVIGRAEYAADRPSYYVRYVAADGRQVEEWFKADALDRVAKAAPSEEQAMASWRGLRPESGPHGIRLETVTFRIEPFEAAYLCINGVKVPVEVSIVG